MLCSDSTGCSSQASRSSGTDTTERESEQSTREGSATQSNRGPKLHGSVPWSRRLHCLEVAVLPENAWPSSNAVWKTRGTQKRARFLGCVSSSSSALLRVLLADILVPHFRVALDELVHQLFARVEVQVHNLDACGREESVSAASGTVPARGRARGRTVVAKDALATCSIGRQRQREHRGTAASATTRERRESSSRKSRKNAKTHRQTCRSLPSRSA